jgi:FtsZ-binding cell division protein ZapB
MNRELKMNMFITVLVLSALFTAIEAFAEQKIVVCGESYGVGKLYNDRPSLFVCNKACTTSKIEDYLKDGWKIDTNTPTSFRPDLSEEQAENVAKDFARSGVGVGMKRNYTGEEIPILIKISSCMCSGTKYVLSKVDKKFEVVPPPDNTVELLKKEIELLKKEIDMLKKDGEALKQENEALKKKTTKKK